MRLTQQTRSLPYWAQAELLNLVCKSHGLSLAQARTEEARNTRKADTLANELQALINVLGKAYSETARKKSHLREIATRTHGKNNGNRLRRELAAAIKKTESRLSPVESLRLDAKTPGAFNYAKNHIKPGRLVTDQEAIVIFTASRKSTNEALTTSEIERHFLTQERHLVKAARTYCRTIGLNA